MLLQRPAVAVMATTLALATAALLTSCTSSSVGPSTPAPSSTPGTRSAAVVDGHAVDPGTVANTLQSALATPASAHLTVSAALAGQTLKGAGDVTLAAGVISRAKLRQDLPSGLGTITVIVIGDKTYAKLPSALRTSSATPWVLLSGDSKSVVVSELASTIQPILAVASPATLVTFTRAAASVTDLGPVVVAGVATTRYREVVDASKLPASVPHSIAASGKTSIPIEIYLDAAGRPVQVSGTFAISGQPVTPTITLTRYNAPVSIAAPPAGQVSTG